MTDRAPAASDTAWANVLDVHAQQSRGPCLQEPVDLFVDESAYIHRALFGFGGHFGDGGSDG